MNRMYASPPDAAVAALLEVLGAGQHAFVMPSKPCLAGIDAGAARIPRAAQADGAFARLEGRQ